MTNHKYSIKEHKTSLRLWQTKVHIQEQTGKQRLIKKNTWNQSPMTGIGNMKQELQSKNHAQNYKIRDR